MRRTPTPVIAFEGPDGVGKSSLVETLQNILTRRGISTQLSSFPGKNAGSIGKLVYQIHHNPRSHNVKKISPTALQALHIAAHIDYLETTKEQRSVTLLDRFWWSTEVYGRVMGANRSVIKQLVAAEQLLWRDRSFAVIHITGKPRRSLRHWPALNRAYRSVATREASLYPIYLFRNEGNLEQSAEHLADLLCEKVFPRLGYKPHLAC